MNPTMQLLTKDFVQVHLNILPKQTDKWLTIPPIDDISYFMSVSLDSLKWAKS